MTNEEQPVRQSPVVRWFIVGLPVGLILFGMMSFVIWFQKRYEKEHPGASKFSAVMRRDLNLDDYRRYVNIFRSKIGPRTWEKAENIAAAQSFIESTLGFDNMGYQTQRLEFEKNGRPVAHISVDLPGHGDKNNVIVVTTDYVRDKDENIAAILSLAHAFTGTRHRKTIRFELTADDPRPEDGAASGSVIRVVGPQPDAANALDQLREIEEKIASAANGRN